MEDFPKKPDTTGIVLQVIDLLILTTPGCLFWGRGWVTRDSIYVASVHSVLSVHRMYPWNVQVQLHRNYILYSTDSLRLYGEVIEDLISEYLEKT